MEYVNQSQFFVTRESEEAMFSFIDNNMATQVEQVEVPFDDADVVNFVEEMNNDVRYCGKPGQNVITEPLFNDFTDLITFANTAEEFTTLNPADVSQWACPSTPQAPDSVESHTLAVSPAYSAASPSYSELSAVSPSYENPESVMNASVNSPNASDEIISEMVAPTEVFGERKRKRGRRPKSEAGLYPEPNSKKVKKTKAYEIDQPFEDKEKERKRLNAVNAKKHRDQQKKVKKTLEQQLDVVKVERDDLKKEVEALRKREADLARQVDDFKKQAFNLVSVLQAAKSPL